MKTEEIRAAVFEALDNATANGYAVASSSPERIATDLLTYDAGLEDQTETKLVPHIREWIASHGGKNGHTLSV